MGKCLWGRRRTIPLDDTVYFRGALEGVAVLLNLNMKGGVAWKPVGSGVRMRGEPTRCVSSGQYKRK